VATSPWAFCACCAHWIAGCSARPDDLHRIAYEYLQDAAAHRVRWSEIFWNPTGTARDGGIAYPQALAAIVRAMHDARADFGIESCLIPAIDREGSAAEAHRDGRLGRRAPRR
jgi:adenosine deaminase